MGSHTCHSLDSVLSYAMSYNNINWNLYKSFSTAYETRNLYRASEVLCISRSAVGQNIKELERQLGVILFTPSRKGVIPTAEANNLYSTIKNSLTVITEAETSIQSFTHESRGVIKLAMPDQVVDYYIANYVKDFAAKYPNVIIEFHRHAGLTQLGLGNIDLLFNFKHKITNSELKIIDIILLQGNLIASKDFLSKHGLTREISEQDYSRLPIVKADSFNLVYYLVKNGLGIGWYCKELLEIHKDADIVEVTVPKINLPHSIISCAYQAKLSRPARAFLDGLVEFYENSGDRKFRGLGALGFLI